MKFLDYLTETKAYSILLKHYEIEQIENMTKRFFTVEGFLYSLPPDVRNQIDIKATLKEVNRMRFEKILVFLLIGAAGALAIVSLLGSITK